MSEQQSDLMSYDIRRVENLTSPMLFDELLGLVSETCLREPLKIPVIGELSPEAVIVQKLGTKGVRAALDFIYKSETLLPGELEDKAQDPDCITSESPLLDHPEYFSDSVDFTALKKAEALGEALLDQAYRCLGTDVEDKIQQYREASDSEAQIAVLKWLHQRLVDITVPPLTDPNDDEEDDLFYHPIRLSPKAIGVFPDHAIGPTCLGVSILAASFLKQAGAEMLHAGVIHSRFDEKLRAAYSLFVNLHEISQEIYDVDLPPQQREVLAKKLAEIIERVESSQAFHAAVYTKLADNKWYQIDPNFRASTRLYSNINQQMTNAHADLVSLKDIAPGIEISLNMTLLSESMILEDILQQSGPDLLPGVEEVRQFLLHADSESLPHHIREKFIDRFFYTSQEMPLGRLLMEQLTTAEQDGYEGGRYDDIFYKTFEKFVLWEQPLDEVLNRCRQDETYLRRRIDDIRTLPFMMVAWYALQRLEGVDMPEHQAVEVGLPETRIGLAVLSDFAVYTDSPLPASFWLSHWPGLVSIIEAMPRAAQSDVQDSILLNNLNWFGCKNLRYPHANGIVGTFRSLRAGRK